MWELLSGARTMQVRPRGPQPTPLSNVANVRLHGHCAVLRAMRLASDSILAPCAAHVRTLCKSRFLNDLWYGYK